MRLINPDINYIYQLKEQLGDQFKLKCWFKDGNPVAFYTTLLSHTETEAHHIGIDYHLNKHYSLYQNILYHLIGEAIINKTKRLNLGRTALEMKSNIGATPENYAAYLKLNNKILNNLVKPFLPSQPPSNWVQRDPFRKS